MPSQFSCPHCKAVLALADPVVTLVRPPSSPATTTKGTQTKGINVITFNVRYEDLAAGKSPYQGSANGYLHLVAALPGIKARGGQVIITLSRGGSRDAKGLSVAAATHTIHKYDAVALAAYIADGTIVGLMIGDDITAPEWGPNRPYLDRYDAIAGVAQAYLPGINVLIRARPGELMGYAWKNKVVAWAQYSARRGDPAEYVAENQALAARMGTTTLFGLNVLNGGDGSSNILGTQPKGWQMSAQEILAYGKVLLPKTHAFPVWRFTGHKFDMSLPEGVPATALEGIKAFDSRPDVRAAFAELQKLGASLPRPPIKVEA